MCRSHRTGQTAGWPSAFGEAFGGGKVVATRNGQPGSMARTLDQRMRPLALMQKGLVTCGSCRSGLMIAVCAHFLPQLVLGCAVACLSVCARSENRRRPACNGCEAQEVFTEHSQKEYNRTRERQTNLDLVRIVFAQNMRTES